jgi:hypothetical protein
LVGPTRYQEGVLVKVLISILWYGVYEGSLDALTMEVDEGNKMDLLWELMKEIVWLSQVHDDAIWWS